MIVEVLNFNIAKSSSSKFPILFAYPKREWRYRLLLKNSFALDLSIFETKECILGGSGASW